MKILDDLSVEVISNKVAVYYVSVEFTGRVGVFHGPYIKENCKKNTLPLMLNPRTLIADFGHYKYVVK